MCSDTGASIIVSGLTDDRLSIPDSMRSGTVPVTAADAGSCGAISSAQRAPGSAAIGEATGFAGG